MMLPDVLSVLTPALVTCGAALAVLPMLSPESNAARTFATATAAALLVYYLSWRLTDSLPPAGVTIDYICGLVFLIVEILSCASALALFFLLSRTRNRSVEVEANREWLASRAPALVDVFICTYNEERAILERTIIGASSMQYRNYRVWVLDDGRREWLRELAAELGVRYLTRPDNLHAKSGNINHALAHVAGLKEKPVYISILDADFVPRPQFLARALCLFRDDKVAIVQTPQHFINPDPIQVNLSVSNVWPDDQRFFFDVLMPSKDAWGVAFCCGTSSVIHFDRLMAMGGFPTDSVTEDYLLTLRMKEAGYETAYLNEPLTLGLAPEGVKEYITQRGRWCLGLMQICRGRSGPLSRRSNLPLIHRMSLVDAFLSWSSVYYAKALGLVVPALYFLFGIRCIDAPFTSMMSYFLPFFIWQAFMITWISRGRAIPIMSDVTQLLALPTILRAVLAGLLRPRGQKFEVTAKGGDRSRRFIEWSLFKVYALLLVINLAGLGVAALPIFGKGASTEDMLAFIWSWYNAIVLMIVCFVCIERPRYRKAERFIANGQLALEFGASTRIHRLLDTSINGARLSGPSPDNISAQGGCFLGDRRVACRIERRLEDSFVISFDDTLQARIEGVRHFYERDYVRPFADILPTRVAVAVVKRLLE